MVRHTIATTKAGGGNFDLNLVGIRGENGAFFEAKVLCAVKDSGLEFAKRRG